MRAPTPPTLSSLASSLDIFNIVALSKYLSEAPVILHSHDEIVTETSQEKAKNVYDQQKSLKHFHLKHPIAWQWYQKTR